MVLPCEVTVRARETHQENMARGGGFSGSDSGGAAATAAACFVYVRVSSFSCCYDTHCHEQGAKDIS